MCTTSVRDGGCVTVHVTISQRWYAGARSSMLQQFTTFCVVSGAIPAVSVSLVTWERTSRSVTKYAGSAMADIVAVGGGPFPIGGRLGFL